MTWGTERGVALVQVLVMAVILLTLVTGVVKVIFGTHVMVARGGRDIEAKGAVEDCLARLNRAWGGNPCSIPVAQVCVPPPNLPGASFRLASSPADCAARPARINIVLDY